MYNLAQTVEAMEAITAFEKDFGVTVFSDRVEGTGFVILTESFAAVRVATDCNWKKLMPALVTFNSMVFIDQVKYIEDTCRDVCNLVASRLGEPMEVYRRGAIWMVISDVAEIGIEFKYNGLEVYLEYQNEGEAELARAFVTEYFDKLESEHTPCPF